MGSVAVARCPLPRGALGRLGVAGAVLAVALALAACVPADEEQPLVESEESGTAEVASVVDGDTLVVRIGGVEERVRVIGVNAPEEDECLAAEAGAWVRARIGGETVALVSDETDRDRFGRLLRYVEHDDTDVGVELVRAGLAIARRYPPDTARAGALDAAQAEAEGEQAGMWAPDACGTPAAGVEDVVIGRVRFDAAGDDSQNLDDEWVRIDNRGEDDVDLTDWVLKDESATNRYRFPDGFTLGAGATVTVRSGCGIDTAGDLHWCVEDAAVWNNAGDTAFLLDPAGNLVDTASD